MASPSTARRPVVDVGRGHRRRDGTYSGIVTDSDGGGGSESEQSRDHEGRAAERSPLGGSFSWARWTPTRTSSSSPTSGAGTEAGTVELAVGVRREPPAAWPTLLGRSEDNRMASIPGAPWWQRGELLIEADGSSRAHVGSPAEPADDHRDVSARFRPTGHRVVRRRSGLHAGHERRQDRHGRHRHVGSGSRHRRAQHRRQDGRLVQPRGPPSTWQLHVVLSGSGRGRGANGRMAADGSFLATATENGGARRRNGRSTIATTDRSSPGHPNFRRAGRGDRPGGDDTWPDGVSETSGRARCDT